MPSDWELLHGIRQYRSTLASLWIISSVASVRLIFLGLELSHIGVLVKSHGTHEGEWKAGKKHGKVSETIS